MPIFNIKLLWRKEMAEDAMAFIFEKPDGFNYSAGQFGYFTLIKPKRKEAEGSREYSLANPPFAKDLMIAIRMRNNAFNTELKKLPPGAEVKFDAPHGSFILHTNATIPAVFLTGGIGVTPVRSIVMQATKDKLPHPIFLFYSNYRPEDAAFLKELKNLEEENFHYKFIPTMTEMNKSEYEWQGEVGYINKKLLEKYINDLTKPIYYLSGSAAMVDAMRKMLSDIGVTADNIRTEEFFSY